MCKGIRFLISLIYIYLIFRISLIKTLSSSWKEMSLSALKSVCQESVNNIAIQGQVLHGWFSHGGKIISDG